MADVLKQIATYIDPTSGLAAKARANEAILRSPQYGDPATRNNGMLLRHAHRAFETAFDIKDAVRSEETHILAKYAAHLLDIFQNTAAVKEVLTEEGVMGAGQDGQEEK